ncbi:hypothetical protein CIG2463D_1016 [Campylobacter iguaniorum]|uniref:hypothetical protein n=1 Tax=Campylobacter iguaniorum TaxID=1244531 RepID=UPI000739F820|nr:hypothetical protein [Campylobacter iguaniorum]ALV24589.1 hypothetical protein CIG2463D_1016 [Campylobacter iguaniorum]
MQLTNQTLFTTEQTAENFGTTIQSLGYSKRNHADELIENIHYFKAYEQTKLKAIEQSNKIANLQAIQISQCNNRFLHQHQLIKAYERNMGELIDKNIFLSKQILEIEAKFTPKFSASSQEFIEFINLFINYGNRHLLDKNLIKLRKIRDVIHSSA